MNKKVRPRRDFQGLEQRRKRAARYFEAGKLSLAEIARELKVSRQSVSLVSRVETRRGRGFSRRRPRGPETEISTRTIAAARQSAAAGARAHGFQTGLWTLPRVAKVVERLTGVRYHPGHMWKVLKPCDGLCNVRPHRPGSVTRKSEALVEAALAGAKKKARRQKAWIFFQDESGVSQRPSVREPGRPKGRLQS